MAPEDTTAIDERYLATGDEAGTAPADRPFRPDVEGLRAVAVGIVVLYHANAFHLTGGYVGVDVFFVISGFVITGLLLRERNATGSTSILDFYARRCRRILPAATLVILAAVFFSYLLLGFVSGNSAADDGRWAAAFLSNFHFEAVGTNYLGASRPPSPLQNYWSLSVEEQFYVVFPTLFLLVASTKGRLSLRARMSVVLGVVIVASYWLSIAQTASNPTAAYFSPFTRAWELALGALVAVATSWLKEIPRPLATAMSWVGLIAVLGAAFSFSAQTEYPGSLVAIPVIGAAMVITGGAAHPRLGAESLLSRQLFLWLGRRSYSLYLWHWPILIIAAERVGKSSLPVGQNLILVVLALALSVPTYALVENPIRHWRLPSKQSVGAGIGLVICTIVILTLVIDSESTRHFDVNVVPAANSGVVLNQVSAAAHITHLPGSVQPPVSQASTDFGGNYEGYECQADLMQARENICNLGDPEATHLVVVYGDSHALMWLPAFEGIAKAEHWRLVVLGKPSCPAAMVTVANKTGVGELGGSDTSCDLWHQWAVKEINQLNPNVLIVSEEDFYLTPRTSRAPTASFTSFEWRTGITEFFDEITGPNTEKELLGNIPLLPQSVPVCLAAHPDDVQRCSAPVQLTVLPLNSTERSVATSLHIRYIDPTPWFCSKTCTAIISHFVVYLDADHITGTYAKYLQNALAESLGFPRNA